MQYSCIKSYISLYVKNIITQIAHYNSFHFLRYAKFRCAKYLFTCIQKLWNTLKCNPSFKKDANFRANNSRILRIYNAKFSGYYFYMNTNNWRDFQICISLSLRFRETVERQNVVKMILYSYIEHTLRFKLFAPSSLLNLPTFEILSKSQSA